MFYIVLEYPDAVIEKIPERSWSWGGWMYWTVMVESRGTQHSLELSPAQKPQHTAKTLRRPKNPAKTSRQVTISCLRGSSTHNSTSSFITIMHMLWLYDTKDTIVMLLWMEFCPDQPFRRSLAHCRPCPTPKVNLHSHKRLCQSHFKICHQDYGVLDLLIVKATQTCRQFVV